jgi:hypothetical protein
MEMRLEEIFELAESKGWLDDFGRWNFQGDEKLLEFVYAIQASEREFAANYIKRELETAALDIWSEIMKDIK